MAKALERLSKADQISFQEDRLYRTFSASIAAAEPLRDHVGRHFTGHFESFQSGQLCISDDSPEAWEQIWQMVGVEIPPMQLPADCKFQFITLGRKNHDTVLELLSAKRSLSGIKMDWGFACIHTNGKHNEQAQYHITVLPKGKVETNLNRMDVTPAGQIIRTKTPA